MEKIKFKSGEEVTIYLPLSLKIMMIDILPKISDTKTFQQKTYLKLKYLIFNSELEVNS